MQETITNKFKIKPRSSRDGFGRGVFARLERTLKLENYFEGGFPIAYVPKILFVMVLG